MSPRDGGSKPVGPERLGVLADIAQFLALFLAVILPLVVVARPGQAAAPSEAELTRDFAGTVQPFLDSYCVGCHGKDKPKGQLDLSAFTDVASVVAGHRQWETVLEALTAGEMPPEKAQAAQPTEAERGQVVDWIAGAAPARGGQATPATPGPVLARRLSNAEYDYTVRDLTGVDIRPTREFPVDPANEAGFDNSGESLAMSPALLKKYLEAARARGRAPGAAARGLRLRPAPGGHRDRPRQVRRRCGSSTSTSGSRPTWPPTSWPPGATSTGPRWGSRRPRWPSWRRSEKVSPQVPGHGVDGADRDARPRSGRWPSCRRCWRRCRRRA